VLACAKPQRLSGRGSGGHKSGRVGLIDPGDHGLSREGLPLLNAPRTDPSERNSRTKCARAHLVRYVASAKMWRRARAVPLIFNELRYLKTTYDGCRLGSI
jgi:hypothetical protein